MVKSTITLASGKEMPLVGFGLWKVPKDTAADTVYNVSFPSIPISNTR
jgi:D-xylose reductase